MESAFRMVVANIYSLSDGPVVTGRIESGRVRVGDNLVLHGALGQFPVQVTSIHKFRKVLTEAVAGSKPVGIGLSGIERNQIRNRDLLVSESSVHEPERAPASWLSAIRAWLRFAPARRGDAPR
jgi:elongation factor Tu